MARTDLTVVEVDLDGWDFEAGKSAANVDGHAILNNGRTAIMVENADASSMNVTLNSNRTIDGLVLPDKVVAVPAGDLYVIWLGPRDTFNQVGGTDDGKVHVDFSSVTSLSVAAIRIS